MEQHIAPKPLRDIIESYAELEVVVSDFNVERYLYGVLHGVQVEKSNKIHLSTYNNGKKDGKEMEYVELSLPVKCFRGASPPRKIGQFITISNYKDDVLVSTFKWRLDPDYANIIYIKDKHGYLMDMKITNLPHPIQITKHNLDGSLRYDIHLDRYSRILALEHGNKHMKWDKTCKCIDPLIYKDELKDPTPPYMPFLLDHVEKNMARLIRDYACEYISIKQIIDPNAHTLITRVSSSLDDDANILCEIELTLERHAIDTAQYSKTLVNCDPEHKEDGIHEYKICSQSEISNVPREITFMVNDPVMRFAIDHNKHVYDFSVVDLPHPRRITNGEMVLVFNDDTSLYSFRDEDMCIIWNEKNHMIQKIENVNK